VGAVSSHTPPPYQSRPGRFAVVVDDLSDLRGPTSGVVELPHRLLWRADRSVDLGRPWQLSAMYEIVLCEAVASMSCAIGWMGRR
jgi:hypothetical protein